MPDTASASADSSSAACGAGVVLDLTVLLGLPGRPAAGFAGAQALAGGFRCGDGA